MNVLFVCRGNLQRSPTAEDIVRDRAGDEVDVRSAGVSPTASTEVDRGILEWAHLVYAMTEEIRERIWRKYPDLADRKDIRVLGIEDRFRRGEPRLIRRLLSEFSKDDFLSGLVDGG